MAKDEVSDLLVKFVTLEDDPIPGECQTTLPKIKKSFLRGFDDKHMFEVTSFNVKTGLGGDERDEAADRQKKAADETGKTLEAARKTMEKQGMDVSGIKLPSTNGFKKFRGNVDWEKARYPVDMKPVSFERYVDLTSPYLLWHCIQKIPFKSATMVKRKAAGSSASGEAFLRFDFTTVLITSIDWDDGQPIKETVEFVCRAVTINYKPQLPDGSLGAAKQAFWVSSPRSSIKPEQFRD